MKGSSIKNKSASNKVVTIDLSNNVDNHQINNNYLNSFKKNDKKKQIELKSKIDIQMNYNSKGNNFKSEKVVKRIMVGSPIINLNLLEENKLIPSISRSKEKVKKTFSEIHKNLSSLEISEKEDEEEKVFRNSKTYQKATKVVNMKPYEMKEDKNYKTISKFYQDNEYCCKSNRNLNDFKPNSIKRANNNFQNSMNQIENRVEFQFEKDPSINKVLNLGFTSLLENYNKLKSDFGFLNETCNEYLKVIEILKAVILSHQVYFYLEIE